MRQHAWHQPARLCYRPSVGRRGGMSDEHPPSSPALLCSSAAAAGHLLDRKLRLYFNWNQSLLQLSRQCQLNLLGNSFLLFGLPQLVSLSSTAADKHQYNEAKDSSMFVSTNVFRSLTMPPVDCKLDLVTPQFGCILYDCSKVRPSLGVLQKTRELRLVVHVFCLFVSLVFILQVCVGQTFRRFNSLLVIAALPSRR